MSAEPVPAGSVELRDYLMVLRRQWWLITLLAVVGAGVATAWTLQRVPVYRGTASVLVQPVTANRFEGSARPDQQVNVSNEKQVVLSSPVAQLAGKTLNSPAPPDELLQHVGIDVPSNSQVMQIHYSDPVPRTAARGANAFAKAYIDYRKAGVQHQVEASKATLQKQIDVLAERVTKLDGILASPTATTAQQTAASSQKSTYEQRISNLGEQIAQLEQLDPTPGQVIESAALPTAPVSPEKKLDVGLGLFFGLFLGLVAAFVRDRADSRLRGRQDLAARLDRPVLATIPRLSGWKRRAGLGWTRRRPSMLVTLDQPTSPAAEAYRTLRTRMARLAAQLDINSIMVVSGGVGEGKSTTAANLAVALAESGRDVLLVSADLRRPRVHQFFALPNRSGLADLLADGMVAKSKPPGGKSKQTAAELWSVAPHLWVILSGPPPTHPSTLMDSDAMREFLKEQRDVFDFIILDCPPALVVSDSLALAPLVDAVLVVADARSTDREAVYQLRDQIEQVGGKIVGSVLNRSTDATRSSYYYDYHD